jgi:hypothetical protein
MIWCPKPGQAVELRYRKSMRDATGLHAKKGTVLVFARGPKTKNALVRVGITHPDRWMTYKNIVVPRGNLRAI